MAEPRWIVLAILFAARAATGFQFQSVGSSASFLMHDLALDYAQIGLLIGAYLLPGVVVAFPAGMIGQRCQDKAIGLAGLALMVVAGLALALSGGFWPALVARIASGIGGTMVVLVATKMVTDWFDRREIVLAMSILQMSWPFGAMVALPIQAMVAQVWGWPAVMLSGALAAAAALGAFALVPVARAAEATAPERGGMPGRVLAPVIVIGLAWGAMNLACILFFSYAPLLMTARGVTPALAASLTSLSIWFTILAIPAGGYLVHRLGRPISATTVCALAGAGALALFAADRAPTLACLAFGIAVGPLSGAILSLPAQVLQPAQRSVGLGIFYTCFYALMAIGPSAVGRLQDHWRTPAAGLVAAAALLAAVVPLALCFAALAQRRQIRAVAAKTTLPAAS